MRKVILSLLLVIFCLSPVYGWEFQLDGIYKHDYWYISRAGTNDLFGNTNIAQSSTDPGLSSIGLSGPFNGVVSSEAMSAKGSDASFSLQKLWLYPVIRINQALSLKGEYTFQGNLNGLYAGGPNWANPPHYAGGILGGSRAEDGNTAMAVGTLRTLWMEAHLPWGLVKMGRFPVGIGPGWSGLHQDDYRPTFLSLTVPYGPLSFFVAQGLGSTGDFSDPYDTRNANKTPLTIGSQFDKNQIRMWDSLYAILYQSGSLDMGFAWRFMVYNKVHGTAFTTGSSLRDDVIGSPFAAPFVMGTREADTNPGTVGGMPAGSPGTGTQSGRVPIHGDVYFDLFVLYAKYFNGRFFLNAEYDQEYIASKRGGARMISGFPRAWMLELGGLAGPAKLSLATFLRTGHQRSGGELNFVRTEGGRAGVVQVSDRWSQYLLLGGGRAAITPYTFLMDYYGTGNNSYDPSGYATYQDFVGYAARIDYAMAANLNLYTSYLYGQRQSKSGSWWGQYGGGVVASTLTGNNVPDVNIGWEWNLGLDWRLIDGMTFGIKGGYWKPGDWFKHAYVDLSSATTITDPVSGNAVRINPGRTIDPIIGVTCSVQVAF